MSGNEPIVRFEQTTKHYGEIRALEGLDLALLPGEVFGLLGPNGAGKTTALRLLTGLERPDSGRVTVRGIDVAQDPLAARRELAYLPDGAPLYANLSPRQHLALVGRLFGLGEDEIRTEGDRLLIALDLGDRLDDPVGRFSRGMRQKAALACALLPRPGILILDEPLSGLDAPTAAVFKEILRAWADRGGAVLYTSHLLDVVERVCDRMAILDHGKLVGLGTLDELRERAGSEGSLEEVFTKVARSGDPREAALRVLG